MDQNGRSWIHPDCLKFFNFKFQRKDLGHLVKKKIMSILLPAP